RQAHLRQPGGGPDRRHPRVGSDQGRRRPRHRRRDERRPRPRELRLRPRSRDRQERRPRRSDLLELRAGGAAMTPGRGLAAAAALACAAVVAGCGLGPGPSSSGTASLTVTRDYGSKTLEDAEDTDPPESDTVIRLLDREAD